MYSYTFVITDPGQFPNTYTIAGSNDGTTWYLIQSVTMNQNPNTVNFQSGTYIIANQSGEQTYTTSTRSATFTCTTSAHSRNSYRYFRIIAPTVWGAPARQFGLGEWFINFTTTTVSPQLSGLIGNTSSGTPVPTSWAANNITWTCDASSVGSTTQQVWIAFNNAAPTSSTTPYSWASLNRYAATGLYTGSVSTTISAPYSAPYLGEWLQIQSSVPVVLYNYTFACASYDNIPRIYLIAGSNDGTNWYPIQLGSMASNPFGSTNYRPATSYLLANYTGTQTLTSVAVPAGVTVTTTSYSTSANAYTYFRIISNQSFLGGYFELEEWFVNFTPTQYVTSNYLSATSSTPYTAPVFSPALTSTNVPIASAASQTGQYMVLITNNTSGANVYYSTNYGANFTGLTIGTSTMVSCTISLDGSCITVMNATTVYQLNNNSIGFSVSVGNQAGQQNQGQNAVAIGSYAGQINQTANSIVLNATGSVLNSYVPGFYVSPIQQYGASTSSSFSLLGYGTDNQIVQTPGIIMSSSGNVGIGTTNPTSLLHVNGGITASGNVSINGNMSKVQLIDTTGNRQPSIEFMRGQTTFDGNPTYSNWRIVASGGQSDGLMPSINAGMLGIYHNGGGLAGYSMVLSDGGNVGIGITNPVATLQIYGDATSSILQQLNEIKITGNGFAHWSIIGSRSGHNYFSISNTGNGAITGIVGTDIICITTGNNFVGIGITNPGYALHVVGSIYASGDITAFSDKRYKENILPLTQSLDNLSQLTGYSYTRSDLNSDKKHIGLIAQEVKEVFPQAVSYDDNQGLYSVNYGCLIAPVIQAIKELKETVNALQEKVDKQDAIIQIFLDHFGPEQ